jgi:hypothetical protein
LHDLFNVEKTIFTTLAHFSALSVSSSNITQPKSTKNRHNPNKSNDRKSTNGNSNRQNKELHYNHFLVLFYLYISIHIDAWNSDGRLCKVLAYKQSAGRVNKTFQG